jgi:hypothetical protein
MRAKFPVWLFLLLCVVCICFSSYAQVNSYVQKVRGYVTDAESKQPLQNVVVLLLPDKKLNATTDSNGYYVLENVPIGRQSFQFFYLGYETKTANELLVTTGKEVELNVALSENLQTLKEVSISANKAGTPLNEFAMLSARSFSVEETRRYAATISDPARMSMNFAGVSGNGDLDNSIVVRGNSPRGVLWRLEGVEIPNPNHFSDLGNSGGAVSMLNANTMSNSDFYTGAFPPEIGNALSGAFDLSLRSGNKDTREHAIVVSTLGTEIATEGPFKKGGQSSYLFDYRYSTLTLVLDYLGLNGLIPDYQDLSFKLNFPTKKSGTFTVFGIGGRNKVYTDPPKDSTQWSDSNPNFKLNNISTMGAAGITHQYFITPTSYVKTIVSSSIDKAQRKADTLNPFDNYNPVPIDSTLFQNTALRLSVMYNNKLSTASTLRAGVIAQALGYALKYDYYDYSTKKTVELLNSTGSTEFYQAYLQWKQRFAQNLTLIVGLHGSYYALNSKYSIEPRASLSYMPGRHKLSVSAGLHSKPDNISTYMYRAPLTLGFPNQNLDLQRAFHSVLGYEVSLPLKSRLKAEVYYQYLYAIGVEADTASPFSMINAENVYSLLGTKPLVSEGTGQNYGIDLTLERPLADNYYIMITASLFTSNFTTYKGESYRGHFDRGYQLNLIGGKEFYINRKKTSLVGVNGKFIISGGQRESPVDVPQTLLAQKVIYTPGQYYTLHNPYYLRTDWSAYLKFNRKKLAHTVEFGAQNVTNRRNYSYSFFDFREGKVKFVRETGIIPAIGYRIEF